MRNHYKYRPDVLEIVVDDEALSDIDIRSVEYPYGMSKEQYCFINGILIGEYFGEAKLSAPYYKGIKVGIDKRHAITLTPCIQKNEYILTPNFDDFFREVEILLRNGKVDLICEADCDQNPILDISLFDEKMESQLSKLKDYILGVCISCPTFIIRKI